MPKFYRCYSLREAAELFGGKRRGAKKGKEKKPSYALSTTTLDDKLNVLFLKHDLPDETYVRVEQKTKKFTGRFGITHNLSLEKALGIAIVGKEKKQVERNSRLVNTTFLTYDLILPAENGVTLGQVKNNYKSVEVLNE